MYPEDQEIVTKKMLDRRQCEEHMLPLPKPSDTIIDAFRDWLKTAQYYTDVAAGSPNEVLILM